MKSILAFVTICCLAATAPAGLQFTINDQVVNDNVGGGNPYVVNHFSIWNETTENGIFEGGAVALYGDADFGKTMIFPGMMPGDWSFMDLGFMDLGQGKVPVLFISWDVPAIGPFHAGKLIDIEFKTNSWRSTSVKFYNELFEPVYSVTIDYIPEPATLALLGLGMALIRRRNRRL
jgi:hypothetical protein